MDRVAVYGVLLLGRHGLIARPEALLDGLALDPSWNIPARGTHPMIAIDLKALRQALQLTQAALGLRVGVHACTVSRWGAASTAPPRHATRLRGPGASPPPHADQGPAVAPPHSQNRHSAAPRQAPAAPRPRPPPPRAPARRTEAPARRTEAAERTVRRTPSDPAPCRSPTASASLYQGEFEDVLPTLPPARSTR